MDICDPTLQIAAASLPPSCTETLHRLHRLDQPSTEVLIRVHLLLLF